MLLKSYFKLLIIIIAFTGCKTNKIQIVEIERNDFCQITNQLIERLQKDQKLKSHFGIDRETPKFYLDTLVENGTPYFFRHEVADKRAKDGNTSTEEIFYQVELEMIENQKTKFRTNCIKNKIERKAADIQIQFWYSKKDNWIALDASNILKKPGYSIGYIYLVQIDSRGEIKNIKETSWQE